MDFDGERQTNFTWHGDFDLLEVSSVEIVLAPARSVWDDHFDENDNENQTASFSLHKMENGVFAAVIPLKMNTYHFLFRLNNRANDLVASNEHNVTYLANGRKLNYINVGDSLDILLAKEEIDGQPESDISDEADESGPLITSTSRLNRRTGIRKFFICCYLE